MIAFFAFIVLASSFVSGDVYCSKWLVSSSAGIFVMDLKSGYPGVMSIDGRFNNRLSRVNVSTSCPGGLTWSLHAGWLGKTGGASSSLTCGDAASRTFNHYDPTFACGPDSQWANSSICQRRKVYNCSTASFGENNYNCEVGDLSGKFGTIELVNNMRRFSTTNKYLFDTLPPADADFQENSNSSTTWSSLVVQCGDTRLFCSKIYKVESWDDCVLSGFKVKPVDSAMYFPGSKSKFYVAYS
jgi:hypothetical protein